MVKQKKMENKENKMLDYQEFHDTLVEMDYLPTKIDYSWTDTNEDFMREILFSFYSIYVRLKKPELLHSFLKLYSDVISAAHSHFPEDQGYL